MKTLSYVCDVRVVWMHSYPGTFIGVMCVCVDVRMCVCVDENPFFCVDVRMCVCKHILTVTI